MSLSSLVITLVAVLALLWSINRYLPPRGKLPIVLNVAVFFALVLWLLYGFGVFGYAGEIQPLKLR